MEFFPLLLQEYCSRLSRNDESLTELSLKCCGMQHDTLVPLLERLQDNKTVQVLDLHGNDIRETTTELIGSVLKNNQSIQVLKLNKNVIDSNAVIHICKGLRDNSSLKELSLDDNNVGPEGGIALGELLSNNSTIERLSVRCNSLGSVGCKAILEGLLRNNDSALRELCLSFNDVGQVATALEELLVSNHTLKVLRVWCAGFDSQGAIALARGLSKNSGLEELSIGQNNVGNEGAIAISKALCTNRTLKKLHLHRNNIGPQGAKAILEAVQHSNFSVEVLKLGSCSNLSIAEECELLQVEQELLYWLQINRAGRGHVFREAATLSESMWPHILARVSRQPNVISCFLQAKPELVKG